jgi:hypothetical protein
MNIVSVRNAPILVDLTSPQRKSSGAANLLLTGDGSAVQMKKGPSAA